MEVSVTRRVIGAVVLGILAAILLPQVFDGDGRLPNRDALKIPPIIKKPDVSTLKVDLPIEARASTNVVSKEELDVVATKDEPKPSIEKVVEIESDSSGSNGKTLGVAPVWSLQIASFKESSNAAKLRDKLRNAGFRSFNKETRLSDGSLLTQVLVGPVQDYEQAEQLKKELIAKSKGLGVSGPPLIVKYSP